jgi:pterin-4a-carbinolamine dehydratase
LERIFGSGSFFMDAESIEVGSDWSEELDHALNEVSALIVLIGRSWLILSDEYGRRYIDQKEDWVHKEILHALQRRIALLPVLIGQATVPVPNALPTDIMALSAKQMIKLTERHWRQDFERLVKQLESAGFVRNVGNYRFPRVPRDAFLPAPLSEQQLREALEQLCDWRIANDDLPGQEHTTELVRKYGFKSFESVMSFMMAASSHISTVQHHPRWENQWRTLIVRLTTWDIGHKITRLDVELARYLDGLFEQMNGLS